MMPAGAQILTIQMQGNTITLWAQVNEAVAQEPRHVEIFGTGWAIGPMPENLKYLSTVQDASGFVWHIYERI